MSSPFAPAGVAKKNSWITIGVIALIAICAGIVVPQMLPADSSAASATSAAASADPAKKTDLAYTPPSWPEAPDPKAMILRLVLGTTVVLGLCAGTLVLSKRWLRQMPMKASATGPLVVVDSLSLGNRCHVHLVGVGKQRILVGVDASGLKSLVPVAEPFEETLGEMQESNDARLPLAA